MPMIQPEVFPTPDCPTVRFRLPKDQVDLEKELARILHIQGWGLGTFFHVQFISHDRTQLFWSAQFVVIEEKESVVTSQGDGFQTITKVVTNRSARQTTGWWSPELEQRRGPGRPKKTEAA